MKRSLLGLLVVGVTAGNCPLACVGQARASAEFALPGARIVPPLYFEANGGQAALEVKFLARGPDGLLFLTQREVLFRGRGTNGAAPLRMRLAHANEKPEVLGDGQLPGHANYYFPTTNAWQATYADGGNDVFIAKVSPDGKLLFSTYFGGSGPDL